MNTRQVINNTKWIIIFKVVQSIVQLLIGMVSARYLGPSNYGLINYASSIVAFALPIMKLGFDSILVYELVTSPEKEGEIMGTSVAMSLVSGFFCILGVSLFASVMNPNDTEAIIVCVLYSIFVVFAALELFQFWFQYKLLSKYSSMVMLAAYILVSVYKIILLATGKNVYWFAVSHSVEYSAIGAALIISYFKCGGNKISFSFDCAKRMLSRSRHYILATLMVVVIQNIDHVMLTNMIGKDENGIYAAAITCASVAQFVYMAIFDSFRPLILTSKNESVYAYERNISRLYAIIVYMALANSLVFTVFAPVIIDLLYGPAYHGAIAVLRILVWYRAFSFMGTIRNIWLLAEEKQNYLPFINFFGIIANILMNALLIPSFGACGAAFASLMTQVFVNFIFGFIYKPLRKNNELLLKGIDPRFMKRECVAIFQKLREKG